LDDRGRPCGAIAAFLDITQRERAEEALQQSERRERERAEELATFLEAVPTPVIIVHDSSGVHMTGNRASDELLRHPRGTEISLSAPTATRPRHFKAVKDGRELPTDELPAQRAARGEEVRDFEFSLVFDDGTTRHVLGYGTPLRGQDGPRGAVHVLVDITERRRAEEALRELNATLEDKVAQRTAELEYRARQLQKLTLELSQAEERERRRIAVVLHEDLQQQIAAARFHLNTVRNKARDGLQTDVDRVGEMLKEAIEKSRSLSHDLSPAVLHMNDLAEVLQWLASRARAQHGLIAHVDVRGEMALQSEVLTMFLFRATQEVLFNVVKHAGVNEATIRVRRIRRHVCLRVSDQGRGFDLQALSETSGIGLFSIRERVELLGGRMKIKSEAGRGSRFSIVVPDGPRAKDRDKRAESAIHSPAAVHVPSSDGALRVLLVDDHEIVRQGLGSLLQGTPDVVVVGEAANGRDAINMANQLRPDVVIMDVSMPLMTGEEATRQIKTVLPGTRVIALSMYGEPDKMETMYEAGAESYVLKTASAEELLAAIRG
jgi:signal transduction histidine kinase